MRLQVVKPSSAAEKRTRSTTDTIEVTPKLVAAWARPPFQREFKVNQKCMEVIEGIRVSGIIEGALTLGVLNGETYLVDGQHRVGCFLAADIPVAYADTRTVFCTDMAEMAEEFVKVNSPIRRMAPDDVLRGLEACYEPLRFLRSKCPFIGYDKIRRSEKAPVVSMSLVLRMWRGSSVDVPAQGGQAAAVLGASLTTEDAEQLSTFLGLCYDAWGRDVQYARLWSSLNLTLCAWLYRRTVITQYSAKTPKLNRDLFKKCLMSLSADSHYLDWLVGRALGERDRSPAYQKVKRIFSERLTVEMSKQPRMPDPAWTNG